MATSADSLFPAVRFLKDFKPTHIPGVSKNAILSFDRYKAIYILSLVGFHQHLLGNPTHKVQVSSFIPYTTVDHGVELMMGMLLITGWLSSATWKEASWKDHMKKKVARLIPPYAMALILTAAPVLIRCSEWTCIFQYLLECTTLAGWNPALMWWTNNRPLWFLSTALTYHYASPFFLRWIRKRSVKQLCLALIGLYALRTGLAIASLLSLQAIFGNMKDTGRVIHCWTPIQVWIPAMGAILEQLVQKVPVPDSITKAHLWIATDVAMLVVAALTDCIPILNMEVLDMLIAYNNLCTGIPLMLLVTLLSCDCNSLRFCTSVTKGLRDFFAGLLGLSYTLYLVHWPLDILFRLAGLFEPDTWDSVAGCWALEVCFAIFLDMVLMDSVTRAFVVWLQCPAKQSQKSEQADISSTGIQQDSEQQPAAVCSQQVPATAPRGDRTEASWQLPAEEVPA
jgi:peptidoglycan/LPS O-acetylase OafA/YrhL